MNYKFIAIYLLMIICGIDPSYQDNNAIAFWDGEKLFGLASGSYRDMMLQVQEANPDIVILEDSRLMEHVKSAMSAYMTAIKKKRGTNAGVGAAAKAGRSIGKLDGVCQRWDEDLKDMGFAVKYVNPSSRRVNLDLKLKAPKFKLITGYEGRTNEHQRDAAMLVFKRNL